MDWLRAANGAGVADVGARLFASARAYADGSGSPGCVPTDSWSRLDGYSSFCVRRETVLDRELNSFSEDHAELKLRYTVAFVAATLGNPAVLLLDGTGVSGDPVWGRRIEAYLDSIHGRTTVIWSPYSTAQIQNSDQMVIIERGSVLHAGPTTRPRPSKPWPSSHLPRSDRRIAWTR